MIARLHRVALALLGVGLISISSPTFAAGPREICSSRGAEQAEPNIDNAQLAQATTEAESILSGFEDDLLTGDKALEKLVVTETTAASPGPAAASRCNRKHAS